MSDIDSLIAEWLGVKKIASQYVERERELRRIIFAAKFPQPKEGTNTVDLGNNWKLKGGYPIDRKLDMPVFEALQNQFFERNIPSTIVKTKQELDLKTYRTLNDEQRLFFDAALIIKPGSVSLEIIPPKEV